MSSRRLPGKMLRPLGGRPLIDHVLHRLAAVEELDAVVVATSDHPSDDVLAEYCDARRIPCVRGELEDVAARFCRALDVYPADRFVRVCGDRPLLDPALVRRGLALFDEGDVDVVTNVFPASYPPGQTVEVIGTEAFRRAYPRMERASDREHVTAFFYREPTDFRIRNFASGEDYREVRFVLDTAEDAAVLERVLGAMTGNGLGYSVSELVALYRRVAA
jgi:spore coat polysaccharide biosynthesis protein SpsF